MSSNEAVIGAPVMWPNFLSCAFHCARLTGQRYLNPRQLATPDVLIPFFSVCQRALSHCDISWEITLDLATHMTKLELRQPYNQ